MHAAPPAAASSVTAPPTGGSESHPYLRTGVQGPVTTAQLGGRLLLGLAGAAVAALTLVQPPPMALQSSVRLVMIAAIVVGALLPDRDALGRRRQRALGVLFFTAFIADTQLTIAAALVWALIRLAVAREESFSQRLGNGAAVILLAALIGRAVLWWPLPPGDGALIVLGWRLLSAVWACVVYAAGASAIGLLDRALAGERHLPWRLLNWVRSVWPVQVLVAVQAMVVLLVCELAAEKLTGLLLAGVFFLGTAIYYYISGRRRAASLRLLRALGRLVDGKDPYTAQHSAAVATYAAALADRLGLAPAAAAQAAFAAELHDVGKIGVPDDVLRAPGRLDDAQFARIKQHPVLGGGAVGEVQGLGWAARLVRAHHEREDGNGYPDGLSGARIPRLARVLSVADAYDALTSTRTYRAAMTPRAALAILRGGAGTQWWAPAVAALGEMIESVPPGAIPPLFALPARLDLFA